MLMLVLHIVLGLIWLVISAGKYPGLPQQKSPSEKSVPFFRVVQYLTIICFVYGVLNNYVRWEESTVLNFGSVAPAGLVLASIALFVFYRSRKDLGTSFSPCVSMEIPDEFVCEGIYSKIRHPIYSSNLLFLSGAGISTGSFPLLVAAFSVGVMYVRSARIEEISLERAFNGYAAYKAATGAFIPKII